MNIKNSRKAIVLILATIIAIMMLGVNTNVFAEEPEEFVAEVNGTGYTDFFEAYKSAREDNKTIKLLTNVVDKGYFGTGKGFTLDLNGHTLTLGGFVINGSNVH